MASQHIEIQGNETRLAGELRRFVDDLRRVMDKHGALLAILNEAYTGEDTNGLAVALGITADKAVVIRTYMAAIEDEINAAQLKTFVNRLG